ncbi:unnamed protein product [Clavelina lepadiformis]|uniref:Calcineurin-like phosphoesterase domain-containing protein n=1 Tax=Clavelina lepadiformis TaxID=159417 RepID=A0ABP0GET5_CLALP
MKMNLFVVWLPLLVGIVIADQPQTNIPVTLNGDVLNFMMAGDFGGWPAPFYTTPTQITVAEKMGQSADVTKPSFILALGDNFYFLGVKDERDERFKKTFEDVYTAAGLFTPWYPTMGNHDWHGNAHAQLDYSHVSKRWWASVCSAMC